MHMEHNKKTVYSILIHVSRNVCWPHQCCTLVRHFAYMQDGIDRQTSDRCIYTFCYIWPV